MVISCWVRGCTNRSVPDLGFFSIPKVREHEGEFTKSLSEDRRRLWLANINRKVPPTQYSKICSDHFISGRPASMYDRSSPDWAPTLKLPPESQKKHAEAETTHLRFQKVVKKRKPMKKKKRGHAAAALFEPLDHFHVSYEDHIPSPAASSGDGIEPSTILSVAQSQADDEVQRLLSEDLMLPPELNSMTLTQCSFQDNDQKVQYFTGLPNFEVLMLLVHVVLPFITSNRKLRIGVFDRLLMTLMKLKLNVSLKYLSYRFKASGSTVSSIFLMTLHILYVRLGPLIYWPQREDLRKTMPEVFQTYFPQKTPVILDCVEMFIHRPTGLTARAETWSQEKHHNTLKYLVGLTPQGSVSFISHAYGGRASNAFITEHCGILQKLSPGDLLLAGSGFNGSDGDGLYCAENNGKSRLSATDAETTGKLGHVESHVERVVGFVTEKFMILQGNLATDYLLSEDGGVAVIDKIITVCCALTNMCESAVDVDQ